MGIFTLCFRALCGGVEWKCRKHLQQSKSTLLSCFWQRDLRSGAHGCIMLPSFRVFFCIFLWCGLFPGTPQDNQVGYNCRRGKTGLREHVASTLNEDMHWMQFFSACVCKRREQTLFELWPVQVAVMGVQVLCTLPPPWLMARRDFQWRLLSISRPPSMNVLPSMLRNHWLPGAVNQCLAFVAGSYSFAGWWVESRCWKNAGKDGTSSQFKTRGTAVASSKHRAGPVVLGSG